MRGQELLELVGGVANAVGQPVDDLERLLVLAHLQQLVDEILVGLQRAQQLGEVLARLLELADRALGCDLQLAPALDQELLLLRLVARLLLERLELVLGALKRLGAEIPDGAVVRDRAEQRADMRSAAPRFPCARPRRVWVRPMVWALSSIFLLRSVKVFLSSLSWRENSSSAVRASGAALRSAWASAGPAEAKLRTNSSSEPRAEQVTARHGPWQGRNSWVNSCKGIWRRVNFLVTLGRKCGACPGVLARRARHARLEEAFRCAPGHCARHLCERRDRWPNTSSIASPSPATPIAPP